MNKNLVVKCPKCKTSFEYKKSKVRPFCSERCKEVDLGHWFQESYKVPSKAHLEEDDLQTVLNEKNDEN